MAENLKQKAARGIVWKFLDQGGTQLIQFISGIYIARLLSPEDYGLVGMMAIFMAISTVFIDSGFRAILIQKSKDVTRDDMTVVFYFNLFISLLFFLLIFFSAPIISEFYHEPKLVPVARWMAINLVLSSLGLVHQVIFDIRLNFRTTTKIGLISQLISVFTGVGMAILGYGVWALVAMTLVASFIRTVLLWVIHWWLPDLYFNFQVFRDLFAKSSKMLFAGILNQTSQQFFSIIIGRFYTTLDVGFYSQGKKLQSRIGDFITSSIQNVMLPVQSQIKDDIARLKNTTRVNVRVTTLIAFPAIIGLIVIAEPFVELFLTEKWMASVYYIQVLSVAGIFSVLNSATGSYMLPIGRINLIVKFTVFYSFVLFLIVFTGLIFKVNLKILILAKVFQEVILLIVYGIFSRKIIGYGLKQIMEDAAPAFIFSLLMGAGVYFIGKRFSVNLLVLFIQVVFGMGVYILLNYLINRKMFQEILSMVKTMNQSRKVEKR